MYNTIFTVHAFIASHVKRVSVYYTAVSFHDQVFERLPWNGVETWLRETFDWLYLSWYMDWGLVMQTVGLAVVLTAIRMVLNSLLFKVQFNL